MLGYTNIFIILHEYYATVSSSCSGSWVCYRVYVIIFLKMVNLFGSFRIFSYLCTIKQ